MQAHTDHRQDSGGRKGRHTHQHIAACAVRQQRRAVGPLDGGAGCPADEMPARRSDPEPARYTGFPAAAAPSAPAFGSAAGPSASHAGRAPWCHTCPFLLPRKSPYTLIGTKMEKTMHQKLKKFQKRSDRPVGRSAETVFTPRLSAPAAGSTAPWAAGQSRR